MGLKSYTQKRDFKKTPEPEGRSSHKNKHLFVIQKHAASHLHYDFRLELNGVLLSWAIPKGPCLDSTVKRLAIQVEDHPVEYGYFEGIIPKGEYGGGTVMLWDKGTWIPLDDDPAKACQDGHLRFALEAEKLNGRWDLVRIKDDKQWFLIKYHDEFEKKQGDYDITKEQPDSVISQQSLNEISKYYENVWTKKGLRKPAKPKPRKITIILPDKLAEIPFPDFIPPQLATLASEPPEGDTWLHEVKFDGYRILAFVDEKNIMLKSRNNLVWSNQFTPVVNALETLPDKKMVLDGEVVLLDQDGKSNFQLLQNTNKTQDNAAYVYYVFDILYYDKYDLKSLPLIERKAILKSLLINQNPTLRYSDHIIGNGKDIFAQSCNMGLEGIISKRTDSSYIGKRSKTWLKIKCSKRQEFVIGGYTKPKGSRRHFGSLFLGVFNAQGDLEFTGNVGTGFTDKSLDDIFSKLQKITRKTNPFSSKPPEADKATWVKPVMVAEVEFTEWTNDGHLRHPSFKGLRLDKQAEQVTREKDIAMDKIKTPASKTNFKISHPDKVLYPEDGFTKQDLLDYYDQVSDWILPFIKNRPLSLVRCPDNYQHCFFQRHFNNTTPQTLHPISIESHAKSEDYIYLNDKDGLLSLVQMGVLEIHPWGSQIESLETPDVIIFDLDPAPDVIWKKIVAAAFEIKDHLEQYGLVSFVKTTGGKGLHVVIPVKPEYDWDLVKNFSHVFVEFLEKQKPASYISKMSKAKRVGKIFVDYLRNQRSSTAIGAYSSRARIHAPVSVPIHWDELTADKQDTTFTIATLPARLDGLKSDPWHKFWTVRQSLHLQDLHKQ